MHTGDDMVQTGSTSDPPECLIYTNGAFIDPKMVEITPDKIPNGAITLVVLGGETKRRIIASHGGST